MAFSARVRAVVSRSTFFWNFSSASSARPASSAGRCSGWPSISSCHPFAYRRSVVGGGPQADEQQAAAAKQKFPDRAGGLFDQVRVVCRADPLEGAAAGGADVEV